MREGPAGNAAPARGAVMLGRPRVHLRVTDSTNERARELALAGAPAGTLVTATEQTAGRGRQGRRWSAPAGSAVLMSLILRPPPRLLPLMAALAVCDVAGAEARIKWPNDVVVEDPAQRAPAKLAGILAEGRPAEGWAVLGIGLNVAVRLNELPPGLRPGSDPSLRTGLAAATMGLSAADVEPTLSRLLAALAHRLAEPDEITLEEWRRRDALRGRTVSWGAGRGTAAGIDGEGRLIVELEQGGRTALGSGEVHLAVGGR